MKPLLLILALAYWSLPAAAHKPLDTSAPATRERPVVIRDHQKSWAVYHRLAGSQDVDYYLLAVVQKGDPIDATLLVPAIDRLVDFHPVLALLGPGLPVQTAGLPEEILVSFLQIAPGEGVIVKNSKETAEPFFEPFTQTKYWPRQSLHLTAPADGQYYLAIFAPSGKGDKYVLTVGRQEDWEIEDLLQFPKIWWQVRMFAEKKRSTYLFLGFLAFLFFLLIALLMKGYRKKIGC